MTCDETRVFLNKAPSECTAAERAALVAHYIRCPECQEWVRNHDAPPRKGQDSAMVIAQLSKRDSVDPEVISVLLGKDEHEAHD